MIKIKTTLGLALIALLTLTFVSCEKNGNDDPDYVGTWVNEEQEDFFGETVTVISKLILTKSTFEMSVSLDLDILVMQMAGMKGNLSVTGNQITIMPTSVAMADDEGNLVWVNKGEAGWADALDEMDMDETETGTYRVEGNQLYITVDGSEDVFTRE
jgi:hypothetical protein